MFRNCEQPESWVVEGGAPPKHIALAIRSCRADSMTVLSPNFEEIGVLDMKTATTLMLLKKVSEFMRFSLFLGNAGDVKSQNLKERQPKIIFPLEINVYGPSQNLTEVGEVLSGAGMFLQEPNSLDHGIIYQNPHFLSWDDETTTIFLSRQEEISGQDFAKSIEEAMNCSNATLHPPRFVQDRRVMTRLKRFDLNIIIKTIADLAINVQTPDRSCELYADSRRSIRKCLVIVGTNNDK